MFSGIASNLWRRPLTLAACLWLALASASPVWASDQDTDWEEDAAYAFEDVPLKDPLNYPAWFESSFLDLPEDLQTSLSEGKKGIILYFGQKRCSYCQQLLRLNWGLPDVVAYTREHFNVIPIDIWSTEELTDPQGQVLTQRQYAQQLDTTFTPSLVFVDQEGRYAMRLRGYYPPYQFRAALEYVADGHYQRESFADYLARGDLTLSFEPGELNEEDFFSPAPHWLDRSRFPGQRPLAVFFEQADCHACDVLHGAPLSDPAILNRLRAIDSVQLDINSETPVVTPDGRKTTSMEWAKSLGLFYTPSLLFFDIHGREVLRVDSVVGFFRLRAVLDYIAAQDYLQEPSFLRWHQQQR